jgi:hypothetical protein
VQGKELLGVHSVVFASFGKVVLDLPYFAAMALVAVAFWRLPSLYRRLKAVRFSISPYRSVPRSA